jgi:hypothetical protein
MPKFLIALHRPHGYDPGSQDEAMHQDIDALNDEMVAAGVRVFVGGLKPPATAISLTFRPTGEAEAVPGPYLDAKEYVDGFWVLDVADEDEALLWGRKATAACRAPVEVRPFH